jgi:hypothetical protein
MSPKSPPKESPGLPSHEFAASIVNSLYSTDDLQHYDRSKVGGASRMSSCYPLSVVPPERLNGWTEQFQPQAVADQFRSSRDGAKESVNGCYDAKNYSKMESSYSSYYHLPPFQDSEIERMRKELRQAQSQIALLSAELEETRNQQQSQSAAVANIYEGAPKWRTALSAKSNPDALDGLDSGYLGPSPSAVNNIWGNDPSPSSVAKYSEQTNSWNSSPNYESTKTPLQDQSFPVFNPNANAEFFHPRCDDEEDVFSSGGNQTFYPIKYYNESLNYRRLLERSVSCNWTMIVDRIVLDNDQQASIFLQQKLKIATPEQKSDIVAAIIAESYNLMINRFGNFLVQRCLEYGTPDQVAEIGRGMIGHIVDLAMDPFGCHVIQKTLDCVDSKMKNIIIEEMISNVRDSMVHRYACHVWQKLFELRWESAPPQFMKKVNQDLEGCWVDIALGETGSLVVQNIFENCVEEDKKPCIEEIIANLDTVIRGQWGNWVIQHMVEHAGHPYRQIVVERVINCAPTYSLDQFASKAVEKMLKMGDKAIIQAFLNKVVERDPSNPRLPLVSSMNGLTV